MVDYKPPKSALEILGIEGGSAPSLVNRVRGVATGLGDDIAVYANMPDADDAKKMKKLRKGEPVSTRTDSKNTGTNAAVVGDEGAVFKVTDPVVDGLSKTGEMVGYATIATDMALPLVGGAAGLVGLKGVKSTLNAPSKFLSEHGPGLKKIGEGQRSLNTTIQDGLMLGFSAISAYGVAKGFSQNLDSLKHMYSEVTGVPPEKVSTIALLTGKVPEVVAEARSHFLKEYVSRGAISAIGLGLIVRGMRKGGVGLLEGLVPTFAGMGVDMLMGESALPYFAGVSNAHKAGQEIPGSAYAEFLMASSKELKSHGNVGRRVAMIMGDEYAKEKASPTQILREIEESLQAKKTGQKSKFDHRIEEILAKTHMDQPQQAHGAQARGAHGQHEAGHGPSMVERVNGAKTRDLEVKGKFTQKLKQEMTAQEPGIAPGIT
jgi:hypothetical protein